MKNIMLDLETMGTHSNSAIVSIGAVEFDKDLGVVDRFYKNIDIQSCLDKGLEVSGSTITWWMKRSEEARNSICKNIIPLKDALKEFKTWIGKGNMQIWGNGAAFDNAILKNAYLKFKVDNPWPYHSDRCYRTIVCSFNQIELNRKGVFHNALDDAETQANHLIKIVEQNKLQYVL